jgi:hypothetical protein
MTAHKKKADVKKPSSSKVKKKVAKKVTTKVSTSKKVLPRIKKSSPLPDHNPVEIPDLILMATGVTAKQCEKNENLKKFVEATNVFLVECSEKIQKKSKEHSCTVNLECRLNFYF